MRYHIRNSFAIRKVDVWRSAIPGIFETNFSALLTRIFENPYAVFRLWEGVLFRIVRWKLRLKWAFRAICTISEPLQSSYRADTEQLCSSLSANKVKKLQVIFGERIWESWIRFIYRWFVNFNVSWFRMKLIEIDWNGLDLTGGDCLWIRTWWLWKYRRRRRLLTFLLFIFVVYWALASVVVSRSYSLLVARVSLANENQ